MRPQYSITTAPVSEPITYDQAAAHVRVDSEDDSDYIVGLIPVGREYVEGLTARALGTSTWKAIAPSWASLTGSCWGTEIPLYRTPLVSVSHVKYYPTDSATLTTMSTDDYLVITGAEPGLVKLTGDLPDVDDRPDAIQITFVAGYSDPDLIPATLKHAVKVDVSNRYENRNSVSFGQSYEINSAFRALIELNKVGGWVA